MIAFCMRYLSHGAKIIAFNFDDSTRTSKRERSESKNERRKKCMCISNQKSIHRHIDCKMSNNVIAAVVVVIVIFSKQLVKWEWILHSKDEWNEKRWKSWAFILMLLVFITTWKKEEEKEKNKRRANELYNWMIQNKSVCFFFFIICCVDSKWKFTSEKCHWYNLFNWFFIPLSSWECMRVYVCVCAISSSSRQNYIYKPDEMETFSFFLPKSFFFTHFRLNDKPNKWNGSHSK